MRFGGSLLFVVGSLLGALLFACEAPPQAAPVQGRDGIQPKKDDDEKEKTCLGKARLAFDDAACNTCMSEKACCAATIACFDGNEDCAELHRCVLACGDDQAAAPGTGAEGNGTQGTAEGLAAFTANVYPSLKTTCGSCHVGGTNGAPTFLAGDASATRTLFLETGWGIPNSTFTTKGQHSGPPLTATQKSAIEAWVVKEATGGGTGSGGGDGTGTGPGNGTGTGTGSSERAACKADCKAKHPKSVTKWQTYNTCAAVTCKAECLP